MMTPRENMLTTIWGGKPEYVPFATTEFSICGIIPNNVVEKPQKGGADAFGCLWDVGQEGPMNKIGWSMFEEASDWKDHVKMPDMSQFDFKAMAEQEAKIMPPFNPQGQVRVFFSQGDQFMRLVSYMGMENALCALYEDPESCKELLAAYTEAKIQMVNACIDAYHPDIYSLGEDVAAARNMFMSPEVYRDVIKPYHKAMCDAIRARGVIPMIHTCGYCQDIIPDYVEMGVRLWHTAQTVNDIPGILDQFAGKICPVGGWDSQGPSGYLADDDTDEHLRKETIRCMTEYKKPGFILSPLVVGPKGMILADPRMGSIREEWDKLRWF